MSLKTKLAALLTAVVTAVAVANLTFPARAFAPDDWRTFVVCRTSHTGNYDPIVSPGVFPSNHEHQFAGSTITSENPSYTRMISNYESSCDLTRDTAAYWTPTLVNVNTGEHRVAQQWNVYYVNPWKNSSMVPFPPNFMAVSNDWEPHSDGVRIWFRRSCWDGTLNMPSAALYQEHTRTPNGSGGCPAGFGTLLPKMHYNLHFGFSLTSAWVPSSQITAGVGWHGDFWNTWHQPSLDGLVEACLNAPAVVNGQGCAEIGGESTYQQKLAARGVAASTFPPPAPPEPTPTPTPSPEPPPMDPVVAYFLQTYNLLTPEQQAAFLAEVNG